MVTKTKVQAIDCRHFIGGQYVEIEEGKSFENINPATEEVLGLVAEGGKAEVDLAVKAARKALKGPWKDATLEERSKILRKVGDLILERQEELARLECLDTGKPLSLTNTIEIYRGLLITSTILQITLFQLEQKLINRKIEMLYIIQYASQ